MNDNLSKNEQLKTLLGDCAHRDQLAFKRLYEISSGQLHATLLSILRIEAVAEEALQETYVKIWNKASEYKSELGQPLTWMTSIARYHALDVLRKRRIREYKEVEWDDGLLAVDSVLHQPGPAQNDRIPRHTRTMFWQAFRKSASLHNACLFRGSYS